MKNNQSGFSLIELLVALMILGLLMAIAVPAYLGYAESARRSTADATVKVLKNVITSFNLDIGSYPKTLTELITRPTDEARKARWHGPYVEGEEVQPDPWGNPYVYRLTPGQKNPYELYSAGGAGEEGTKEDRIGIWNK